MRKYPTGKQFKTARKKLGYKQAEIGAMVGNSQPNISRIETGKRFRLHEIQKLKRQYEYLGIGFSADGVTVMDIIPIERRIEIRRANPIQRFNLHLSEGGLSSTVEQAPAVAKPSPVIAECIGDVVEFTTRNARHQTRLQIRH